MAATKKLTLWLPVLFAVVAVVWTPRVKKIFSNSDRGASSERKVETYHDDVVFIVKAFSPEGNSPEANSAWKDHNPFRPILIEDKKKKEIVPEATVEKSKVQYHLSGIFWNEKKASAIINGSIFDVGSGIGSSTVKSISPDRVIISDGHRETTLMLRPDQ